MNIDELNAYRKSRESHATGNCVEVAQYRTVKRSPSRHGLSFSGTSDWVLVSDTTLPPASGRAVLELGQGQWGEFLQRVRTGTP